MIRKLSRSKLAWLTACIGAFGLSQVAMGQGWVSEGPPSFSLSFGTTTLLSGGTTTVSIVNWQDPYVWQDGEGQYTYDTDGMNLASVQWSVSSSVAGAASITSSPTDPSQATLTAGTVATNSTVIVTASAWDCGGADLEPEVYAVAPLQASATGSVTVTASSACITLEINQPGPQDNYVALNGTGTLVVGVSGGISGTNYAVGLSCAGSGSSSGNVTFSSTSVTVPSGGTQSLTITGSTTGYFTITGTASGATTGTVGGAVVNVDIVRTIAGGSTTVITGSTSNVMVGQKISLTGSAEPAGLTVTGGSWTVPGTLVKSYSQTTASAGSAALSNSDLSGGTIGYYWIAGGTAGTSQVVKYQATVGGASVSASTTFNVWRPNCLAFTSTTTTNSPAVNCVDNGMGHGLALSFGSSASHGISWSVSVSAPAMGSGTFALTQLININRVATLVGTSDAATFSSSNAYVLDKGTGVHYVGTETPITGGSTQAFPCDDTPHTPLESVSKTGANDGYHTYLQYLPVGADSIWVTLRKWIGIGVGHVRIIRRQRRPGQWTQLRFRRAPHRQR